jgi:NADPH:quinone reductase-like Zn-dependent oxidoreductase
MTTANRAAIFPGLGKKLKVIEVENNHPATGEVLVENYAVALQPLDARMLIAGYGPAASLNYPAILGTSGAGVVRELGEGVADLKVGDRVVFDTKAYVKPDENLKQGTWQQAVVCNSDTVAKVLYLRDGQLSDSLTCCRLVMFLLSKQCLSISHCRLQLRLSMFSSVWIYQEAIKR